MLEFLFSNYQWYRRWRGGTWHYIRVIITQGCFFCWVQPPIHEIEKILKTEEWIDGINVSTQKN